MPDRESPPETCANCGATLPPRARSCPECGADERTGWRENSIYDGLDLPAEAWQGEAESGKESHRRPAAHVGGVPWYWWVVGVVLIACLGASFVGLR
jgi:hypothetical protein